MRHSTLTRRIADLEAALRTERDPQRREKLLEQLRQLRAQIQIERAELEERQAVTSW